MDLTAVRQAAEALGCKTLGVLDQTYFLLALATDSLPEGTISTGVSTEKQRRALKTLVVPGGLGSTMKVMVFGKDVGAPELRGLSGIVRLT